MNIANIVENDDVRARRAYALPVYPKINNMEKRTLGIILTLLGMVGLILAGVNFINDGANVRNVKQIVLYGVLGAIFFFAGVGLIRNTRDRAT
jgi:hypothetical protein